MTVAQLLKHVTSQQQLDPAYFNLVTPTESPRGQTTPLNPDMTIAKLKSTEIVLAKKHKKEEVCTQVMLIPLVMCKVGCHGYRMCHLRLNSLGVRFLPLF